MWPGQGHQQRTLLCVCEAPADKAFVWAEASEKSEQHQHQAKGVSGRLPAGQVSSTKHQAPCTKHQSPGMTSEHQHQAKGVRGYLPAGLIRASIWRKREIIQNTTKANTKNTKRKASVETYLPVLLEPLCRNPGPRRAFE